MKSRPYLSLCLSVLALASVLCSPQDARSEKADSASAKSKSVVAKLTDTKAPDTKTASSKSADVKSVSAKSGKANSAKTRKTISAGKVSLSMEPPAGFTLSEAEGSGGNIFALSDPKKDEKDDAVITISVVASNGKTNQKQFVDGVLAGYREDMKSFKEDPGPVVTINGVQFQNRAFSGTDKTSGVDTVGDIYCTLRNKDYVVFVATANGKQGLDNLAKLTESIRTVKF